MIYIGRVYGGPEVRGSAVDKAIGRIVQLMGTQEEDARGSLDIVLHVPGSLLKPDFQGVRTARFSKKERMLMVQVAIPQDIANGETMDVQRFVLNSVREAIRLAASRFEKAGIDYPEQEYLGRVDAVEARLVH